MAPAFIPSTDTGDNVICLHSSMSSSRQWGDLASRLQPAYRVIALDLHGYGNGPEWAAGAAPLLDQEVALLTDLVEELDGPIHLVGHSYGGAVAIRAAQIFGWRIDSLTLYEPVIFSALFTNSEYQAEALEVSRLIEDMQGAYRCGNLFDAAQRFIDYWSGDGAWEAIPFEKKFGLSQKIPAVLANFEAVVSEPKLLADLAQLQVPTLYLSGQESPASMDAISGFLKRKLPQAITRRFPGMGHMGPITHADIVNERITTFIQRQARAGNRKGYARAA